MPAPQIKLTVSNISSAEEETDAQPSVLTNWVDIGDNRFQVAGASRNKLDAGVWAIRHTFSEGTFFESVDLVCDSLNLIKSSEAEAILNSILTFWGSRDRFVKLGQVFKRGILAYGPPGTGKTAAIIMVARELINRDAIVLFISTTEALSTSLGLIRKVEPDRPIVCVIEELDRMVDSRGESELLQLLDGNAQHDNVIYLATTNNIRHLGDRFTNRPSRFDEIIKFGPPSPEIRRSFIRAKLDVSDLSDIELDNWVTKTDGLSIAHVKELITAVYALGKPLNSTIDRLRNMCDFDSDES